MWKRPIKTNFLSALKFLHFLQNLFSFNSMSSFSKKNSVLVFSRYQRRKKHKLWTWVWDVQCSRGERKWKYVSEPMFVLFDMWKMVHDGKTSFSCQQVSVMRKIKLNNKTVAFKQLWKRYWLLTQSQIDIKIVRQQKNFDIWT